VNSERDEEIEALALSENLQEPEIAKPVSEVESQASDEELSGQADLDERLAQPVFSGMSGIETAQVLMAGFLIVVVALIAYSNAFGIPFHYPDQQAIVNNPGAHAIVTAPIASRLTGIPTVPMVTIAANWWFDPASPIFFHFANILIHALNGVLVYLLARRLLRLGKSGDEGSQPLTEPLAMLAGLMMSLHPLATESVNLVIGRTFLLCTMFALGAVLFMLRAADREQGVRVGSLIAAGVCFALAWACDTIALAVPAFMLMADWIANGRQITRRLAVHAAFWGIAVLLGAWWMTVVQLQADPYDVMKEQTPAVPGTKPLIFSRAIGMTITPSELSIDHDLPPASGFIDLEEPGVNPIVAITTGVGLGLVAVILTIIRSPAGLALTWYLLALLPVALMMPPHTQFTERSLYFSLCGLALLLPWGISKLLWKRPVAIVAGVSAAAVLLAAGSGTFMRNRVWQDEIALWDNANLVSPDAPEPSIRLGEIYYGIAQTAYAESLALARQNERAGAATRREEAQTAFGAAKSYLTKAVDLKPEDADLRSKLGATLAIMNERTAAIETLTEALRLNPSHQQSTIYLASLYEQNPDDPVNIEGRQRAIDYYRRAERLGTLDTATRIAYALALARTGNLSDAAIELLPLNPADPQSPASAPMKQLVPVLDKIRVAREKLNEISRTSPGSIDAVRAEIEAHIADGRNLQAFYLLERLLRVRKDDLGAWVLMGATLARVGESAKFVAEYSTAPAAPEGQESAWMQLARRCVEIGRWDAVREYLLFAATQSEEYSQPLMRIGDLALEFKQFGVASTTFAELAEAEPKNPLPWIRMCEIALENNNLPQARRYLDEAEALGGDPVVTAPLRAKAGATPPEEQRKTRTILD